jgi:hypothetical protein
MNPMLTDLKQQFLKGDLTRSQIVQLLKGWEDAEQKLVEAVEGLEDAHRLLVDLTSVEFQLGRDKPIRERLAETLARIKGGDAR